MTPRLAGLTPDRLDADQRALYDAIAGGPRAAGPFPLVDHAGVLRGPFGPMLLNPPVGDALQSLGAVLRYRGALSARERELAILAVASRWGSAFELGAHEAVGRTAGLTDAELRAARGSRAPDTLDRRETAALRWASALADRWTCDDESYRDAVSALGDAATYEISVIVGYYSLLALHLRIYGGEKPPVEEDPS